MPVSDDNATSDLSAHLNAVHNPMLAKEDLSQVTHTCDLNTRDEHKEWVLTRGDASEMAPSWYVINKERILGLMFEKIYILKWLPHYDAKNWLSNDIQAGVTVATITIPQAIAYANIAGVTPDVGLHTAMAGLFIYPFFGTSRHMTVGAASIAAIMTSSSLEQFTTNDSPDYHMYVNTMALTTGIMYASMSFLGIGFIASFLALPVVVGFAAGCAWVIGASQLKYVFTVDKGGSSFMDNISLFGYVSEFAWVSVIITIFCIFVLQSAKRLPPYLDKKLQDSDTSDSMPPWQRKMYKKVSRYLRILPMALLLLILVTVLSYSLNGFKAFVPDWNQNETLFLVGRVDASLDPTRWGTQIAFSKFSGNEALLIVDSLLLCIVVFTQHIAVSVNYSMKHEYDVHASQELLGLGTANVMGSLLGVFPLAGVITHPPMSEQANCKSLVFNFVTGAVIVVVFAVLVGVPNLLFFLPKSVLAAIVLNACVGMFPFEEMKRIARIDTRDAILLVVTFASTLGVGVAAGVGVGFVCSVLLSVWRSSRPHCAVLGRMPGTTIYRSIAAWPEAITTPGIIVFRFDSALYFGNVEFFKQAVLLVCHRYRRMHLARTEQTWQAQDADAVNVEIEDENCDLKKVDCGFYLFILDCHCVNDIDSSGIRALEKIDKMLANTFGCSLFLVGVKYGVMKHLERSEVLQSVGKHHVFETVHEAKLYLWRRLQLMKKEDFDVKDRDGYISNVMDQHDMGLDYHTSLKMSQQKLTNEALNSLRHGTRRVPMGSELGKGFQTNPNKSPSIRKRVASALASVGTEDQMSDSDLEDDTT